MSRLRAALVRQSAPIVGVLIGLAVAGLVLLAPNATDLAGTPAVAAGVPDDAFNWLAEIQPDVSLTPSVAVAVAKPSTAPRVVSTATRAPTQAAVPSAAPAVTVIVTPAPRPSAVQLATVYHVPVLMYHRIIPPNLAGNSLRGLVVPPQLFAAQLSLLRQSGWHTLTVAQLSALVAAGRPAPPHSFVITIDDGYDDGYVYALPILRHEGFTATYFVVSGRVGHGSFLTAAHVQGLAAAGMEIGAHTVSHLPLSRLGPADLALQVDGSAAALQRLIGIRPVSFAYPFGSVNVNVVRAVARAGFRMAVSTQSAVGESWGTRFVVPRLGVGPWTTPAWLVSLLGPSA